MGGIFFDGVVLGVVLTLGFLFALGLVMGMINITDEPDESEDRP